MRADPAHQALGDDSHQDAGQQEGKHSQVQHARDCRSGLVGVDRRQHQVTGQGRLNGVLGRLRVTDLTDSELSAQAQYRIGECRMIRGQLSEAVDAFVKLSILYQHANWVQRGLNSAGDCYLKLKKPKKAARLYEELLSRFPKCELAKTAQTKLKNIRSM